MAVEGWLRDGFDLMRLWVFDGEDGCWGSILGGISTADGVCFGSWVNSAR